MVCISICMLALTAVATSATANARLEQYYEYCIVGAGPAGLQLAHYMQTASANYVVVERSGIAGSFFASYPRHGKLISINKRWTDSSNTEYSLRHDWNSLLTVDNNPRLLFRQYSQEMFPPREAMVAYLRDYWLMNNLTVHFNTSVTSVYKSPSNGGGFLMKTTGAFGDYSCKIVVMATGLPNMRPGDFPGHELTIGYDEVSLNRSDFEGKRVLIIGKGNSGFEVAQHIYGHTRLIHVTSRSPLRFAWSTHYVGDLRAVNNEMLDTYQLKSLDGLFEYHDIRLEKNAKGELCPVLEEGEFYKEDGQADAGKRQYCYDIVVRATGFVWDGKPALALNVTSTHKDKYPKVGYNFESVDTPGLYFAGTAVHSLDFRQSAGGFVHGFRYTARALHRMLRFSRHGEAWPAISGPVTHLLDAVVRRINEGSGNYQMFSFLGDIALISHDKREFTLLEEVPVRLLPQLPGVTGHPVRGPVLVFVFEYGRNFSGPRADTFKRDRANCDIVDSHKCNFLHPVIYQYDTLPDGSSYTSDKFPLPKPDRLIHLIEDFYTNFGQPKHVVPLAAFLESFLNKPAAPISAEHCILRALLAGEWPAYCPEAATGVTPDGVLGVWSR